MDNYFENIYREITENVENEIRTNNKIISKLLKKYKTIDKCFTTKQETSELLEFVLDVADEFELSDDSVYLSYISSKFENNDIPEKVSPTAFSDFVLNITILNIIR